jgi:hypothetical protein
MTHEARPAMPVVVTCPACQRKARVPDAAVGKRVKCPDCGTSFPAVAADAAQPTREPNDVPEVPALPETPEDEARRVTRIGVGLLAGSQTLLAVGTGVRLLLALFQLVTADTGPKTAWVEALTEFVIVGGSLALLGGIIGALVGAVFCTLPPAAVSARSAAASVLALTVLHAIQAPIGEFRDVVTDVGRVGPRFPDLQLHSLARLALIASLTPEAFEAARQALLALYARSQARRHADRAAAGLAALLAIAYPVVVIGLTVLGIAVTLFSGKPHPTFDQVLAVLVLLTKTVLVALGAFVLLRVWLRLRPA